MSELRDALGDIDLIRGHLARAVQFRGYGPTILAVTGALALVVAFAQARFSSTPSDALQYLVVWVTTAAMAVTLIGVETVSRARRVHRGLAMHMLFSALEQFVPPVVTGLLLTGVLWRFAPQSRWMLPGLWQLLFGLGAFASRRFLPRATLAVGVWYLGTGLTCLAVGAVSYDLSPWEMGIPFGVGQLLVAAVLQWDNRETKEE